MCLGALLCKLGAARLPLSKAIVVLSLALYKLSFSALKLFCSGLKLRQRRIEALLGGSKAVFGGRLLSLQLCTRGAQAFGHAGGLRIDLCDAAFELGNGTFKLGLLLLEGLFLLLQAGKLRLGLSELLLVAGLLLLERGARRIVRGQSINLLLELVDGRRQRIDSLRRLSDAGIDLSKAVLHLIEACLGPIELAGELGARCHRNVVLSLCAVYLGLSLRQGRIGLLLLRLKLRASRLVLSLPITQLCLALCYAGARRFQIGCSTIELGFRAIELRLAIGKLGLGVGLLLFVFRTLLIELGLCLRAQIIQTRSLDVIGNRIYASGHCIDFLLIGIARPALITCALHGDKRLGVGVVVRKGAIGNIGEARQFATAQRG